MATKQTSKILLKKLSALRATLSDDEQILLDDLLLVHEGTMNGEGGALRAVDAGHGRRAGKDERLRIKFDQECETYVLQ